MNGPRINIYKQSMPKQEEAWQGDLNLWGGRSVKAYEWLGHSVHVIETPRRVIRVFHFPVGFQPNASVTRVLGIPSKAELDA